jgi:hypothetical protein
MNNPITNLRLAAEKFKLDYDKQSFCEVELECYKKGIEIEDDIIPTIDYIKEICKKTGYELWIKKGGLKFYKAISRQTFDLPFMLLEEGDIITFGTSTGISYKYTVFATNYVDGRLKVTVE